MVMRYLYTSLNMSARVKNLNEQANISGTKQLGQLPHKIYGTTLPL